MSFVASAAWRCWTPDFTKPWWRLWTLVLPGVLSVVVFEHDAVAVGVAIVIWLAAVFWPLAIAPERSLAWTREHPVPSGVLTAPAIGFPAFTLWFPEATIGERALMALAFAVFIGLVTAARQAPIRSA